MLLSFLVTMSCFSLLYLLFSSFFSLILTLSLLFYLIDLLDVLFEICSPHIGHRTIPIQITRRTNIICTNQNRDEFPRILGSVCESGAGHVDEVFNLGGNIVKFCFTNYKNKNFKLFYKEITQIAKEVPAALRSDFFGST
jgi:hypothetical protein